ncbi:lipopolysaccharide biosynthesis protein [Pseudofulvibacter geojedonensis]|uniref:Lipopolysaccharide biosynthesis protein n=1 Tax=Pseudofulvibacter geojedonensis TaxID=1123758 RepID=A0ABW3I445_9FLAO
MFSLKSSFTKNVFTLVTGTTIAQVIPLALSPILTRLYTPNDFGLLATYMSIAAIFSVVITLKYDISIIIAERKEEAISLLIGSLIIACIISLLTLIIVHFFNGEIINLLTEEDANGKETLGNWLYFIPFSIFFIGAFNTVSFWFNRKLMYKRMATSKVVNTTSMSGIQLGGGLLGFTPIGLLIGFVAGRFFAALYLFNRLLGDKEIFFKNIRKDQILFLLKRYKRFPLFTLPAEFINIVANRLPIFVIGKFFGSSVLGNYALMERVLSAPISLIGASVLDVFKQKASEDYNKFGNCKNIFIKTFKSLVLLSIVPTLLLFFLSPIVFGFIFGKEWTMAGEFAQIISILFFIRFTASPLSYMFNIAEKQHYDMFWQIALLVFTIISFVIGVKLNDVKIALICFTVSYSLLYIINIYLSYQFSKGVE